MARNSLVDLMWGSSQRLYVLLWLLALVLAAPCPAQSGPVICWGDYSPNGRNPVPGSNFVAVCAGGYHGLALTTEGKLVTWGENIRGQCNAPSGGGFTAIAAGLYHNLALKNDGAIVAWGDDLRGQCNVPRDRQFRALAAGSWHSLAISVDGSLVAWGWNDQRQCDVPPGNNYVSVSAGHTHSVALRADGSLIAWGSNSDGQCDVPPGNNFIQVAAGSLHNVALQSNGTVVAWGRKYEGQCQVPAGSDFVSVAAGSMHSLALTRDGNLVAWGHDNNAQCDVSSNDRFAVIAAGGSHSLAIRGSRVLPAETPVARAATQERVEKADNTTTKAAASPGAVSATAGTDSLGREEQKAAVLPTRQPQAQPTGTPDTPTVGKGTPVERVTAPARLPQTAAPPATGSGTVGSSPGSSKQEPDSQPAGSAAPLVLKHTTMDRTGASVPPSRAPTAATSASLLGSPDPGRPVVLPKPTPKVQPRAKLDSPGALPGAPGRQANALASPPQGQSVAAPAADRTLGVRTQALYESLFEQNHLPGILSWAGRPVDLIAIVVFATCLLSIVVLLFRR